MILAIGNINMDWICTIPHLPIADEKMNISHLEIFPGGAASNFAVGLARLGSEVALFGHVGDDLGGKKSMQALADDKVDTSQIIVEPNQSTGFVIILVGEEGQTIKLRYHGANAQLSPTDITPKLLKPMDIVYCASVSIPIAQKVAQVCHQLSVQPALDVGADLLAQPFNVVQKLLSNFTFVFMNQEIFSSIYRKTPTEKDVQKEIKGRMEILTVTLGANGSITATVNEVFHTPGFPVKPVDTTGAGDAYAAGLIHYRQQTLPLTATVKRATACAALQITQWGGRVGLPTEHEVEAFLIKYNK